MSEEKEYLVDYVDVKRKGMSKEEIIQDAIKFIRSCMMGHDGCLGPDYPFKNIIRALNCLISE